MINEGWSKNKSRKDKNQSRNNSQDGRQSSQNGCLNSRHEGLAKRDSGLPRRDGGLSRRQERKEPALEETESKPEHQEAPKEEAAVETIGALEDWYGDRYLVVGGRRQPKKRTQGDGGSRKKLAVTRGGWLFRRAVDVPDKDTIVRDLTRAMYAEPLRDGRSGRT
jgi:hypothetical protein